jgi:predicted RNase H-like nuclease
MTSVMGVDGCPAGWIAITLDIDTGALDHRVYPNGTGLAATGAVVVAIDIPIGLPERGRRICDEAARQVLGRPRASSVFPVPIRPALAAQSRLEADRITRGLDGRGVGVQAWNLYGRIRDIDQQLRDSEMLRARLYECHPEVCFWAMNGGRSMLHSKHSRKGVDERRHLIDQHFGTHGFQQVRHDPVRSRVADDDILDAFALCWTAHRILDNRATPLPDRPPHDNQGLPMRILY